ncbi:(2Fe-2S)-binding protein [Sediminispirochaeta bajacaliforniensis]|uniref:(2Fe-2S)-binding protein n=1 Tax=Sediminispirochaeta bajacaliforniensis TaxID=148 RepID=UPI00037FFFE6|nr:2Fe-2S iron-sulfur cluster-binding protein [Sediminispirochaeta bajacaliforniensis]
MTITLTVNGQEKVHMITPGAMLVDVLRSAGYTEVKKGCDTGSCGVCTVLLDGLPILSCSYLAAKADGHEITTIRGLEKEAAEFSEFLVGEGADQCGFCSPGLALTVMAMKKELKAPSDEEIKHYLAGNLCRCSGYEGQLRAIKKYLEACRG